jgi:gas vesicle protein
MDEDKRISYFCLGLGIGVAVGILFAPKSGEETRQLIRSKAEEGGEYVKRRSLELRDQANEMADRGKHALTKQKEQLANALEAGKQAYRDSVASDEASSPDAV